MRFYARCAFFLSGLAGLTFEIIWLRHLGLALGATTLAVATTTAAYMGGLAVGSHWAGKFADRIKKPVWVYGALEVVIALFGLWVPTLCKFVPFVDQALLTDLSSGTARALLRFVVAALILAVPTTAMGMTLPVLARAVTTSQQDVGREVGFLYAMNLLGAVAGAALSGFVLIPALGLFTTNLIAVGCDLVLGLAAMALGRKMLVDVTEPSEAKPRVLREGGALLVSILVATGASAMALQVLWTRGLGTALGPSTYAFSAIVCAYLIGLAIGGIIASRLATSNDTKGPLAAVLAVTGLAVYFGISVIDDLPLVLHGVVLDPTLTMGGLLRTEFGLAALSLLPATIGMGALFPLTLAAVVGSDETLGAAVGRAYAVNTVGNILGSFLGVFILLPTFGVEWGMRVAALSYPVLACVLAWNGARTWKMPQAWIGAAALGALLLAPSWDISRWTVGLYRLSMARAYFPTAGDVEPASLAFHADGMASTVTVEEDDGVYWIKVNGKIDGSSEGDMPTQVLSGLLPMLVHAAPDDVAVIGCGSCVTAGSALRGGAKSVTLIELEPQVVEAAKLFAEVNGEPWKDPRFSVVEDDGRNFMMRPGKSFDVIISEPSNPWMTGAASLFTQEFFQIAQTRLKPNGMFLQWLQAYELAPERIAAVLRTFQSVFPHVLVFSAHPDSNDLLLLGGKDPITLEPGRMNARFAALKDEAARAELTTVHDLLALLLFTNEEFDHLPETALNTDDNALIEFGAPKDLLTFAEDDPHLETFTALSGHRRRFIARLQGLSDQPVDNLSLAQSYLKQGAVADARVTLAPFQDDRGELAGEIENTNQIIKLLGNEEDDESLLEASPKPLTATHAAALKELAKGNVAAALKAVDTNGYFPQSTERLTFAYLLYKDERYDRAWRQLNAAKTDPLVQSFLPAITYFMARASYYDGHYLRGVEEMRRYINLPRAEASAALLGR